MNLGASIRTITRMSLPINSLFKFNQFDRAENIKLDKVDDVSSRSLYYYTRHVRCKTEWRRGKREGKPMSSRRERRSKERKRAIVSRSFSRTLTVKLQCAFIRDRFNSATVFLPPIPRREIINFRRDSL